MNRLLKGVCILYINGNNRLTRVTKSAVLKNSLFYKFVRNKNSLTSHVHNYLHDDRLTDVKYYFFVFHVQSSNVRSISHKDFARTIIDGVLSKKYFQFRVNTSHNTYFLNLTSILYVNL